MALIGLRGTSGGAPYLAARKSQVICRRSFLSGANFAGKSGLGVGGEAALPPRRGTSLSGKPESDGRAGFAPYRGASPESWRKGLVHRGGAAVVGWLLRRDASRSFPRPAPVARRALSARLVSAVNPSRRYAAKPPVSPPLGSLAVSPTLALDSRAASGIAASPSAGGVESLRHIWRSTIPCLPASRKSCVAGPSIWRRSLVLPRTLAPSARQRS